MKAFLTVDIFLYFRKGFLFFHIAIIMYIKLSFRQFYSYMLSIYKVNSL